MRVLSLMVCLLAGLFFGVAPARAQESGAEKNLVANGGFEDGVKGWQYHQWNGKAAPGHIDKADKFEGAGAFKFTSPEDEGGRYMAHEVKVEPEKDYVLSFALSAKDLPANAGRVRLAIEGRGFLGTETGKVDLATLSGTQDWKAYGVFVPADKLGGATKVTIFVYHDKPREGVLGIDGVSFRVGTAGDVPGGAASGAATLRGDTSDPVLSTFAPGEPVELTFRAAGLKPEEAVTLSLAIVNERDEPVESKEVPVVADESGKWTGTVAAPGDKLGFYRVRATLSNGVALASAGSRKAGFLTYAVVPDPAQRENFGERDSRFGMQGGFGPWGDEALAYLGARWVLEGNLEWRKREPKEAGEFKAESWEHPGGRSSWQKFTMPTLFAAPSWAVVPETAAYMSGTLTAEGEKAWDAYCREAAKAYMAMNPDREERIYQITWEPIQPWGFKGKDEDIVRIHEIAYQALHETDPKAVVVGPCRGVDKNEVERTTTILKHGLGRFIDGYSAHVYYSITPERDGMVKALRAMKQTLDKHSGKDLPMFGTEQGLSTHEDPMQDLEHARALIRQNLITLGEGYRFNMAFYIVDYRLSGQSGYGYYYNLVDGVPWAPAKVSPRPVTPAYAAQSLLLDGHDPVRAIEWLGDTAWGYAFQRGDSVVLALWDYGAEPREVSLVTGVDRVEVYDWMGNSREVTSGEGITLTLGPEPVYVKGVSPKLWGKDASDRLAVAERRVTTTPGKRITIEGTVTAEPDCALDGEVMIEPDARLGFEAVRQIVRAEAGKTATFSLELDVPAEAPLTEYPLRLVLREDGVGVAFTGVRLEVTPPISLARVQPVTRDGHVSALAIDLRDERGEAAAGELAVELSRVIPGEERPDLPMIDLPDGRVRLEPVTNGKQTVRFEILPDAEQRVQIPLPGGLDLFSRYHVQAMLTPERSAVFSTNKAVSLLTAVRYDRGITVDGNLEDWASIPPIPLRGKAAVIRSERYHTGDDDLSAQVRFAWDPQALHIAIETADDTYWQNAAGTNIWRGDSVQLAFDVNPRGEHVDGDETTRNSEITIALTAKGPEAFRHLSFDPGLLTLGEMGPSDVQAAIRKTEKGLVYEVALPWSSLGVKGAVLAGRPITLALTVNDMDVADQSDPSALGVFSGIFPTKDADRFGRLWLAE